VPTPFVPGRDPKEEKGIRNKRDIPRPPILHHLPPWLVRIISVKVVDQLLGILEVFERFPTRTYLIIASPLNEVM